MSETKIQVPVGMSEAFHKAENHEGFKWDDAVLDAMLSAALRWLSENPIVPTDEQIRDAARDSLLSTSGWGATAIDGARKHFMALERRMFLAAEPETNPIVVRVKNALIGCTLTAGDAVELMDYVRSCTHPEPEVPSEIRDIDAWLTVYLGSHPEIENIRRNFLLTFRRGQQSK